MERAKHLSLSTVPFFLHTSLSIFLSIFLYSHPSSLSPLSPLYHSPLFLSFYYISFRLRNFFVSLLSRRLIILLFLYFQTSFTLASSLSNPRFLSISLSLSLSICFSFPLSLSSQLSSTFSRLLKQKRRMLIKTRTK